MPEPGSACSLPAAPGIAAQPGRGGGSAGVRPGHRVRLSVTGARLGWAREDGEAQAAGLAQTMYEA